MPRQKKKKPEPEKNVKNQKKNKKKRQQPQPSPVKQEEKPSSKKKKKYTPKKKIKLNTEDKKRITLTIIGDYKSGKSTLIGKLLYDSKSISNNIENEIRNAVQSRGLNEESFYRFVCMRNGLDRVKDYSIECSDNYYESFSYRFNLVDTPGKRGLVRNMLVGLSKADAVLLVVNARKELYNESVSNKDSKRGINEGYVILCFRLCQLLGIDEIIIGINMMDYYTINYNENIFKECKKGLEPIVTQFGFKPNKLVYIPISSINGDNIIKKSINMNWWNGWYLKRKEELIKGNTIADAIEDYLKPPKIKKKKPLRLSISNVLTKNNVIIGKIDQGTLKIDDEITIYPSGLKSKVLSMKIFNDDCKEAISGDNVGIKLSNITDINKGNVISIGDEKENGGLLPYNITIINILVQVCNYNGIIKKGFNCLMYVKSCQCMIEILNIEWKLDGKDKKQCDKLINGDQAEIRVICKDDMIVEEYSKCKQFGRIGFWEQNELIMVGKCVGVKHAKGRIVAESYEEYCKLKKK